MTAPGAPGPAPPRGLGLLGDPLEGWRNDDLLFDEEQRAFVARHHPAAAGLFDWPELRKLFKQHDPEAARFRKRSRRIGVAAVALGCASLIITAFLGGHGGGTEAMKSALGVTAALLAVLSGITGYSGVLSGRDKWRWLSHRFWTERLRQLHFQLIVNHLPEAVQAMSGPAAMEAWQRKRARILDSFEHRFMKPVDSSLQRMRSDVAEDQPWLDPAWQGPAPTPAASADLDELFEILRYQRFGIQRRYSDLKLRPGVHSPRSRSKALRITADLMTVLALLLSAAAGALFAFAPRASTLGPVLALGGALAALILALRVLDEGLQLRSETERYEWYLAAVEALERRYDSADGIGRIGILREMERLSYQELRWFTQSFGDARFIM
jgi:hypothetical protein